MIKKYTSKSITLILLFLLISCKSNPSGYVYNMENKKEQWNPDTPYSIEEFRAAWVATVANINWPSKPGLPIEQQKKEAIALLDYLEKHNFNAVVFQVRPQADALYDSRYEPWSYYLTGKQGTAPNPFYDPLEFWIDQAHKRGLELHAWLNPYRAHHTQGKDISEQSIINTNNEMVVKLANDMWWMDPALKSTQDHSLAVVMDIVKRYNVDGIHFDDYFYPYDSYNNGDDFPDEKSWIAYKNSGGKLSRNDWRRDNVNQFIQKVYSGIKKEKPYVKFGLSPFGIWRPGYPESVTGYDQYEKLFADAKLWLNKGWIDYFSPQLYWKISKIGQSFPELLGWWEQENTLKRHLWPGMNVGLGGDSQNAAEIFNQIMITRGMLPKSKGAIHWSIGPLIKHDTLSKMLVEGPYKNKALVPSSPWLDNKPPSQPEVYTSSENEIISASWTHHDEDDIFKWVLYFKYENEKWQHLIFTKHKKEHLLNLSSENNNKLQYIGLTAVDKSGNQSKFFKKSLNN